MNRKRNQSTGKAGRKSQAVIALGSNLGESTATLAAAAERIAAHPDIDLLVMSKVYTSRPAVVAEQPNFKNAVALIETTLLPRELLLILQEIETEFGRRREGEDYVPGGPRTLDLDIIDIEGVVSDDPQLTLPHPETLRRAFVVTPLLEVSPHHVLANNKVVNANAVDCGEIVANDDEAAPGEPAESSCSNTSPLLNTFDGEEGFLSSHPCEGTLFVCATPIGNLGDITLRVLSALKTADVIYCEDTRVTRKLATRYDISTPLRRADAYRMSALLPTILAELEEGKCLAYVSDAGMPGVSDPGGLLVATVREAGHTIEVLPGASALTTALTASGIKAHNHYFGGFFPRKVGAGRRLLKEVAHLDDTALIFFESVHRTAKTLQLIAEVLPERHVVMARELTKLHEEIASDTAELLASSIAERVAISPLKGEVVLVIAPPSHLF